MLRLTCLLLMTACMWANTTMCRGILVEANAEGDRRGPYIVLRCEYQTPKDGEDALVHWRIPGHALITLDGSKADFSAFKPGRLVWLCNDASFFKVFSRSYRFNDSIRAEDPSQAWWSIHLPIRLRQPSGKNSQSELILHLQVSDGKVHQAAAITPQWSPSYGSSPAWHSVDATQLEVSAGTLRGSCVVTVEDRGVAFADKQTSIQKTFTFALASDGSGTVHMGDKPLLADKGLRILCQPIPDIDNNWYCFLRAPDPASRTSENKKKPGQMHKTNNLHLEARCVDEAVSCPSFRYGYGKPGLGPAAHSIEMTIADGTVSIVATGQLRNATVSYTMTGFIIGDRIFGTADASKGDQHWKTRFSGYLRQADSPSIGWEERDAKKEAAVLRGDH